MTPDKPCLRQACDEQATYEVVVIGHNSEVRIGPVCADHALDGLARANLQHGQHVKVKVEVIE